MSIDFGCDSHITLSTRTPKSRYAHILMRNKEINTIYSSIFIIIIFYLCTLQKEDRFCFPIFTKTSILSSELIHFLSTKNFHNFSFLFSMTITFSKDRD